MEYVTKNRKRDGIRAIEWEHGRIYLIHSDLSSMVGCAFRPHMWLKDRVEWHTDCIKRNNQRETTQVSLKLHS